MSLAIIRRTRGSLLFRRNPRKLGDHAQVALDCATNAALGTSRLPTPRRRESPPAATTRSRSGESRARSARPEGRGSGRPPTTRNIQGEQAKASNSERGPGLLDCYAQILVPVGRRPYHRQTRDCGGLAPKGFPPLLVLALKASKEARAKTHHGEVRELIRQMAKENHWGAPRIHGELLMMGFDVSERTVSRYLRQLHRRPEARQSWRTFLANHREVIAAMDFFTVATASFRVIYVWFVIEHGRRRVVHFNVTEHPCAAWVIQQLREAFPYDTAPRYLVFDRDSIFSAEVVGAVKTLGTKPTRTAYKSLWQNGTAERWVGCARQELLNHVVVLNEAHLRRLLREYVSYYHEDRTHCGLEKETPARRVVSPKPSATAQAVSLARIGGLQHRYEWREAA